METYAVKRLDRKKDITVEVPGSKSITNRALLLAALADGRTKLKGTLFSDDSRHFISSLQSLGFKVVTDETAHTVTVDGLGGKIPKESGEVNVGSAGTAARFITAMLALSGGSYMINASEQMKKRPMKPLFKVLEELGAKIEYTGQPYHLPARILGRDITSVKNITLDTNESTQYLSAMLMTGVMHKEGIAIRVTGSRKTGSYVDITKKMMKDFGCELLYKDDTYYIQKGAGYSIQDDFEYQIEPDVSAACYFYGMGAILGIKAQVKNIHMDSMQGDIQFVDALMKMGCTIEEAADGITVTGPKNGKCLKGIDIDMKTFSDQALTMAAVSIFAVSPTIIRNVGHIRMQESDRLSAIANELTRMGIRCEEYDDSIKIYPGEPEKCAIETYDDHRVAMAFTLAGLKNGGITILNPMCCKKTFENYFELIDSLYM